MTGSGGFWDGVELVVVTFRAVTTADRAGFVGHARSGAVLPSRGATFDDLTLTKAAAVIHVGGC